MSNVSAGGDYSLTLERWHDDDHEDDSYLPLSLQVQSEITGVDAGSSSVPFEIDFNINANSPQPEGGEIHWDNVIIKAVNGSVSCEAIFDYDIRVDTDGDGIPNDEDNCWEVGNPDQTDSNDNCPDPPYSTDPLCGDACESLNQCVCDFDDDGNVYPSDLSVFLGEYGRTDCLISPS